MYSFLFETDEIRPISKPSHYGEAIIPFGFIFGENHLSEFPKTASTEEAVGLNIALRIEILSNCLRTFALDICKLHKDSISFCKVAEILTQFEISFQGPLEKLVHGVVKVGNSLGQLKCM